MHATTRPDLDVNTRLRHLISNPPAKNTKELVSEEMIELLKQGADIHMRSSKEEEETAFMFAAKYCNQKVIDAFMERTEPHNRSLGLLTSNNPDREQLFSDKNRVSGVTATFFAVQNDDANVVKFFLDKIEKVDEVRDAYGFTLLMYAIKASNIESMIQLVDQRGANMNAADKINRTALIFAVVHNNLAMVEILLKRGANTNVNFISDYGSTANSTALMYVAQHPEIDIKIAEKLLAHGADMHAMDSCDMRPICYAVRSKNIPLVELLLSKSIFENASEEEKFYALRSAVCYDIPKAAELFVNAGLNPNLTIPTSSMSPPGDSAVIYASKRERKEILEIFFTLGSKEQIKQAKENALFHATKNLNLELTKFIILEQDVNVNCQDVLGRTPLSYLAESHLYTDGSKQRRSEIAELLLKYGALLEIGDNDGKSPLSYASANATKTHEFLSQLLNRDEDRENGIFPKIPPRNSASSSSNNNPPPPPSIENPQPSAVQLQQAELSR